MTMPQPFTDHWQTIAENGRTTQRERYEAWRMKAIASSGPRHSVNTASPAVAVYRMLLNRPETARPNQDADLRSGFIAWLEAQNHAGFR